MTVIAMKQRRVLTGDIPLEPSNPVDAARERKKKREHRVRLRALTDEGFVVVLNSRNDHPLRGTYQLVTWLQPPRTKR